MNCNSCEETEFEDGKFGYCKECWEDTKGHPRDPLPQDFKWVHQKKMKRWLVIETSGCCAVPYFKR